MHEGVLPENASAGSPAALPLGRMASLPPFKLRLHVALGKVVICVASPSS